MPDSRVPVASALSAHWSSAGFVDQDLSDLADQMHHCRRPHVGILHAAERLLHVLRRHAVTLIVLALLLAAMSAAAG